VYDDLVVVLLQSLNWVGTYEPAPPVIRIVLSLNALSDDKRFHLQDDVQTYFNSGR